MFNFFKKNKPSVAVRDFCFISEEYKLKALTDLALQEPQTIFLCWFSNTQKLLASHFEMKNLGAERVLLLQGSNYLKIGHRKLIMTEHHPNLQVEEDFYAQMNLSTVDYYNSLSEPIFKKAGSERIIDIMKKMGVRDDEAIQHTMISKSIRNVQEKMASSLDGFINASSQEEWIRKQEGNNYTGM